MSCWYKRQANSWDRSWHDTAGEARSVAEDLGCPEVGGPISDPPKKKANFEWDSVDGCEIHFAPKKP